jgi:hypothetical protein
MNLREVLVASSGLIVATAIMMASAYLSTVTSDSNLLSGLTAGVGILAYVVGGLVFLAVMGTHALAPVVVMVEKLKPKEASKRSRMLLKQAGIHPSGHVTVWSIYILMFFVVLACLGCFSLVRTLMASFGPTDPWFANLPYAGVWQRAAEMIPTFLTAWVAIPIWATSITVLYYERRVRLEGFDIESLAGDVWRADRSSRFEL